MQGSNPPAEIAVVIVNYQTGDTALKAVESVLERHHGGRRVAVHLVDNASPNGDGPRMAARIAAEGWATRGVTFHQSPDNLGFGRGNNLALNAIAATPREDWPRYVFLLNPDAWLKNEALAVLADFMDGHSKVGVTGTRSYLPGDDAPQVSAFRFPGVASTFAKAVNFGPVSRVFRSHEVAMARDLPTCRVGWVSGAGVMARFDLWADRGFFDPEYFLYFEEVDLILSCARDGWEVWHVCEAEIEHMEGESTNVRSRSTERRPRPAYWYHSWRHYFQKNHGRPKALMAALAWLAGAALNSALIAPLRRQSPAAPAGFFSDFPRLVLRPLLGRKPG